MNQRELAEWFEVDTRTVRNWRDKGIMPAAAGRAGYNERKVALALIRYYKEIAENRRGAAKPDEPDQLEQQKIRENELKIQKQEFEHAVRLREYAPISLLESYAAEWSSHVRGFLEALPGRCKRRIPHLRDAEVRTILQECAKVADGIADFKPDDAGAT